MPAQRGIVQMNKSSCLRADGIWKNSSWTNHRSVVLSESCLMEALTKRSSYPSIILTRRKWQLTSFTMNSYCWSHQWNIVVAPCTSFLSVWNNQQRQVGQTAAVYPVRLLWQKEEFTVDIFVKPSDYSWSILIMAGTRNNSNMFT